MRELYEKMINESMAAQKADVAVISENSISVVVDVADTALTPAQIAQINTIVYEQTGITPDKTVIIEK